MNYLVEQLLSLKLHSGVCCNGTLCQKCAKSTLQSIGLNSTENIDLIKGKSTHDIISIIQDLAFKKYGK